MSGFDYFDIVWDVKFGVSINNNNNNNTENLLSPSTSPKKPDITIYKNIITLI